MYICNTKQDDVKKAISNFLQRFSGRLVDNYKDSEHPLVIQVALKKYRELKKMPRPDLVEVINSSKVEHLVNVNKLSIHKNGCKHVGKNQYTAAIINVSKSGLRRCKHCNP